jgi:DNA replication ATP-dependent helicase Dna2
VREVAQEWYEELLRLQRQQPPDARAALRRLLRELVAAGSARWKLPAELSGAARLCVLGELEGCPAPLRSAMAALWEWLHRRRPEEGAAPLPEAISTVAHWIHCLTGAEAPEELTRAGLFPLLEQRAELEFHAVVRSVRADSATLWLQRTDGVPLRLRCFAPWDALVGLLWSGATVRVVRARRLGRYTAAVDATGLLVVEPERLLDVTEVAALLQRRNDVVERVLLRRMFGGEPSAAALRGWLINACFDEWLSDPNCSVEEALQRAVQARPLSFLAVWVREGRSATFWEELRAECQSFRQRLQPLIERLRRLPFLIEPAFIAPDSGLQGRMDVLWLTPEGMPLGIVELKSGTPPQSHAWAEHRAQLLCYDLLLRATTRQRVQQLFLFYARDAEAPLRQLRPAARELAQVVLQRNRLVVAERQLLSGALTLEALLQAAQAEPVPEGLQAAWEQLSETEREYATELLRFLVREHWSAGRTWAQRTLEPGEHSGELLTGLVLEPEASDWQRRHLLLRRADPTPVPSALRRGDLVLLSPMGPQGREQPVLKGTLQWIEPERLCVSLRNKYVPLQWLQRWERWMLEADPGDQFLEAQWQALWELLRAEPERRQRLLGMLPPRSRTYSGALPAAATEEQRHILRKALSALDYVLIQGPPGTGKTTFIGRWLVRLFLEQPDEQLLLLAYTNRAVDELCRVLAEEGVPFVRFGVREATAYPERLPVTLAQEGGLHGLWNELQRSRVVLATVATAVGTPELFALKEFSTVIVDEASQLLESHLIGILCRVPRAVLIGDERQLPAIVQQSATEAQVRSERLRQLGIESFAVSLFERLLRQCIRNGWEHAYGMLRRQARMHVVLQEFPSRFFYGGRLESAGMPHQQQPLLPCARAPQTQLEALLARHRLIFVASEAEPHHRHLHSAEAHAAAALAEALWRLWAPREEDLPQWLGIVTPFRLQAHAIRSLLPPPLQRALTVDTVERFQGSQREIVLVSLAVHRAQQLRWLYSPVRFPDGSLVDRRLNVMLTRARQQLVLLGCPTALQGSFLYEQLLRHIRQRGCWVPIAQVHALDATPCAP